MTFFLIILAGFPPIIVFSSVKLLDTTELAAIIVLLGILVFFNIIEYAPIHTLSPIKIGCFIEFIIVLDVLSKMLCPSEGAKNM